MQIGDKVLIPRTGGYMSEGEVVEMYTTHCRVRFPIGETFHGKPIPEKFQGCYGYKTIRQEELRKIEEAVK